ncbi:hypothetical protein MCUN1_000243 [Malassezia cuniculi]|uniref:Condensin complex subunit 2 n=1 Tax=Malassezia cuniculi TaxID=948313 RepID=A0AAF0ENL3_9BASI|nr:hypothetical protein MCUN1_000243 [Malassezia cuniculi]
MPPDARHALGPRRVPSGRGGPPSRSASHRIVSQGLARAQQSTMESPAAPALQVDNTSFEEWMKMATDNKINASNTWSFALIDYFHDMSLLKSDSGDGSINFQKASCTLDGCVKVWTSRVDSVVVETGRLISGLQDEEVAEEAPADEDEDEDAAEKPKRRAKARETTLAKSFSQLQVKHFDLEFAVDPLFKKTSADFDEGGAGGLLMNHLHVDDHMKVVFDASDATNEAEQLESSEDTDAADPDEAQEQSAGTSADEPDTPGTPGGIPELARLRSKLLGAAVNTNPGVQSDDLESILADRVICPSIATFRFAPDDDTQLADMSLDSFELDPETPADFGGDMAPMDMPEIDFFAGAEPVEKLDGQEFDVALAPDAAPRDAQDALFDYFDNRAKKHWAGPEHWKMGRVHKPAAQTPQDASEAASKPARRRKEVQPIDFSDAGAVDAQTIFAPSTSRTGIKMLRSQVSASTHLLPEDQHYSSKRLMRLFLKPKAAIFLRRTRQDSSDIGEGGAFNTALFEGEDPYDDGIGQLAPADDVFFEAEGDVDSDDEFFAADALRRVRPEYVEYAKKAKQVDVNRLKDNIWRGLALQDEVHERQFGDVISGLSSSYTPAKFDEISTSFCFICLLHLANEEGLEISVPGESATEDAPVGQIDALRVVRPP